ncbi:MAG: PAS domain S-box protein [Tenuifilum sp.]|uniref:PAS domain S-box protein n=1 Tax=Tenuifilum sp. TaxID=2760880 RepID=UPI0030B5672F
MAQKKVGEKRFEGSFEYDGELKYRLIFEKSPIGLFQYNTDAVITECNDRFVEILKSKRELLVGLNMHKINDKSVLPAILDALDGKNGYYEGPYTTTTSNAQVYVLLKAVPLTNPKTGQVVGAMGIVEDISDLYRTQEELTIKEERFRILSSLTSDSASILTIQPDGSFKREWLSSTLMVQLGYKPEDVDSFEKWATIVHPDDIDAFKKAIGTITQKGEKVTLEFRIKAKNGKVYWIENTVYPEFDSSGKPFRLISAVKDITAKKEQEQELQQQRNLLKSLVDNAPLGIWVVNPDGSYPIINPWFSQNIGYGTSQFSMTEEEIAQCRRSDMQALNSDGPIETTEEVTFTDGKKHILQIFKQKLTSTTGETIGVLGIANDISERTQYEKALVEALEKAEESDRLKTAFLANMSHEIRTPLNGVIGFAKFLRNFPDTTPQEREKFLGIISTSADHLLTLINDIIDISKIDVGQLTINPEAVNINDLLNEIYTFFYNANPDLPKREIAFNYTTSLPDSKAMVNADRMRLRQVLTNLINNALKFTDKGKVEFGYNINSETNEFEFFVSDTGIGIAKDKQEIIFQRFRQAYTDITKQYGGTGLGLAICKSLVELMGGRIWVESETGKGSTFRFTLPINAPTTQNRGKVYGYELQELKNLLKGKSILIAEDDPNCMYYLKTVLKDFDINILEADNGLLATEIQYQHPEIAAILMDIKMPVMNGYDAIKRIRSTNAQVPIIVQTAHTFSNERAISIALGCNQFITKPIDPNSLYQSLYSVLKESRRE